MASKSRALRVLRDGGKLVNGLVCLPGGGLDRESKGRLTAAQLKSLETNNGIIASHQDGATIHTYKNGKEISPDLHPKGRHQSKHRGYRR